MIDKSNVTAATIPPTNEATSKFLFANYQYICSCLAFCQVRTHCTGCLHH